MKKIISLCVFVSALLYSGSANAELYNIQFNGLSIYNYSGTTNLVNSGVTPDIGTIGNTWNHGVLDYGTLSNILDSQGIASSLSFKYSGTAQGDVQQAKVNTGAIANLTQDYVSVQKGKSGTFDFQGLSVGKTYNLYIYAQGPFLSTQRLIFDGVTTSVLNANHTAFDGSNSYKFTFTATSNIDQQFTFSGVDGRTRINGLQLSTPVPEPSTLTLIGLGGMLVAFRLRKTPVVI